MTDRQAKQKPSVGRIVHYATTKESGGACWAAIVTGVNSDGTCDLSVFLPRARARAVLEEGGELTLIDVREGLAEGEWHWPERVE